MTEIPDSTTQKLSEWVANVDGALHPGLVGSQLAPILYMPLVNSLQAVIGNVVGSCSRAVPANFHPGTYVDWRGVVQYSDVDLPRFEPQGLLVEGISTNLLKYSEDFTNAVWTDPSSEWTIVANNQTAPDGVVNSADTITVTPGTTALIRQVVTAATGSSFSIWFKVLTGTVSSVAIDHGDGTVQQVESQLVDGEWIRVKAPNLVKGASAWLDLRVTSTTGATFTIWGAQFEESALVSSYVPVLAGTAVSRNADDIYIPIPALFPTQAEAQMCMLSFDVLGANAGTYQDALRVSGETQRGFRVGSLGNLTPYILFADEAAIEPAISANTEHRIGFKFGGTHVEKWFDAVMDETHVKTPTQFDAMGTDIALGSKEGTSNFLFGHVKDLVWFNHSEDNAFMVRG